MNNLKYFYGSIAVTIIGILAAFYIGGIEAAILTGILAVLEVSLSFDNAVVNATVLEDMEEKWRKRFLTWGMLIAVFGMRIVFPVVIVAVVAGIGPIAAFNMAVTNPEEYSSTLISAHTAISGFGGAFLMMVGLKYFFDAEKDVHWVHAIEEPLAKLGKIEEAEIGFTLLSLWIVSTFLSDDGALSFMVAGVAGIITYVAVDSLGSFMEEHEEEAAEKRHSTTAAAAKGGFAMFLYLELLDASFSFDGVIGAFAVTTNIFIIAIGLGIGAMFVRSLTIMLVEKGTLNEYRYLEHGAFYAIFALASIMFAKTFVHIPELITGLIGAGFIILAVISSIWHKEEKTPDEHENLETL